MDLSFESDEEGQAPRSELQPGDAVTHANAESLDIDAIDLKNQNTPIPLTLTIIPIAQVIRTLSKQNFPFPTSSAPTRSSRARFRVSA